MAPGCDLTIAIMGGAKSRFMKLLSPQDRHMSILRSGYTKLLVDPRSYYPTPEPNERRSASRSLIQMSDVPQPLLNRDRCLFWKLLDWGSDKGTSMTSV